MRTLLTYLTITAMTLLLGIPVIVVKLVKGRVDPDGTLANVPGIWAHWVLKAAGTSVVVHNRELANHDEPRVYVSNHVSWFEIFALATLLPRFRFVAKKELSRIPLFGPAVGEVAAVYIDRRNRRAAFDTYREAVEQMRGGVSVVVYPEGTRGRSYALRPFKKGPFVLAIAAQAPVVPVVSYGTREIQGKGDIRIRKGTAELTFLEPIPTAGMTYQDRDRLLRMVWDRIAAELERRYGVRTDAQPVSTGSS